MINEVTDSVHKRGGRDEQTEGQTENDRAQSAFFGEALNIRNHECIVPQISLRGKK